MGHPPQPLDDYKRRQENTLPLDTVHNVRTVDAFLWHGCENPTPVQRAGAIIIGSSFLIGALALLLCLVLRTQPYQYL